MASILVHLTHGPEDPTRAALAFLVARTALAEGHDVSVFVAGEGVQLLRPATLDAVQALAISTAVGRIEGPGPGFTSNPPARSPSP